MKKLTASILFLITLLLSGCLTDSAIKKSTCTSACKTDSIPLPRTCSDSFPQSFPPTAAGNLWEYSILRSVFSEVTSAAEFSGSDTGKMTIRMDQVRYDSLRFTLHEKIFRENLMVRFQSRSFDTLTIDTSLSVVNSVSALNKSILAVGAVGKFKDSTELFPETGVMNILFLDCQAVTHRNSRDTVIAGDKTVFMTGEIENKNPLALFQWLPGVGNAVYSDKTGLLKFELELQDSALVDHEVDSLVSFSH